VQGFNVRRQASGVQSSLLQSVSRTVTEGPRGRRMRSALIALEIAASLTLLTGSALMLRSVVGLLHTDFGFSAEHVINASITLRQNRYPDVVTRTAVFDRMLSRLGDLPGAESVGLTTAWPIQQPRLQLVETSESSARTTARSGIHGVSEAYFATMRVPIVAGRAFGRGDRNGTEPVAVVSETLARRLWPAGGAIGGHLTVPQEQERGEPRPTTRLIVGVVRDVRQNPADQDLADLYVPILEPPGRFAVVLLRTRGEPERSLAAFRSAFRDIDPEISVTRAGPLQDRVDDLVARPRFLALLLAAFASIAPQLSLVGVYSGFAYAVRQREREIAVRMALGADARMLTRFFVKQGSVLLGRGLLLGLGGALAAGRLIESQLFGVTSRDPAAIVAAVTAFGTAGLFAIWWPSRRAASTDPAIALRSE
jgi:putative ABC transport system permease protein